MCLAFWSCKIWQLQYFPFLIFSLLAYLRRWNEFTQLVYHRRWNEFTLILPFGILLNQFACMESVLGFKKWILFFFIWQSHQYTNSCYCSVCQRMLAISGFVPQIATLESGLGFFKCITDLIVNYSPVLFPQCIRRHFYRNICINTKPADPLGKGT